MGLGLRAPKARVPGNDVAGRVEAVGENVRAVPAGRRGLRSQAHRRRLVRRVRGRAGRPPGAQTGQPHLRAGGGGAGLGRHGAPGSARQGPGVAGAEGAGHRRGWRRGHLRRAARQVVRRRGGGRLRPGEGRPGPLDRRRPRDRPHQRGFRRRHAVLRSHPRTADGGRCGAAPRPHPARGTLVIVGGEGGDRWLGGFDRQMLRTPVVSLFASQTLQALTAQVQTGISRSCGD